MSFKATSSKVRKKIIIFQHQKLIKNRFMGVGILVIGAAAVCLAIVIFIELKERY